MLKELDMSAIRSGMNPALLARQMGMGAAKEMGDKLGSNGGPTMYEEEEEEVPEVERVAVDPEMAKAKRRMHAAYGTDIRSLKKLPAASNHAPVRLSRGLAAA